MAWVAKVAVLLALVLGSGACSPSRNTALEEETEGLRATLDLVEQAGLESMLDETSPDERRCVDREISERGVDPNDALRGETVLDTQEAVNRILHDCVPDLREHESYLAAVGRTIDLSFDDGQTATTDEVGCLLDHIWAESDDPIATFVRGDGPDDPEIFYAASVECLPASRLDGLFAAGGYGDDPALDALYDDCEAGDDRACDLLYGLSAAGSDYEAITLDCAGRGLGLNDACSPDVNIDPETGYARVGDPGVVALVDDCRDGDLLACDLAFQISSNEDPLSQVAYTCGERVAIGGIPNCRAALGDG